MNPHRAIASLLFAGLIDCTVPVQAMAAAPPAEPALSAELHSRGWIVASAQTSRGDWDLFVVRPDGTERRPLTDTPEFNEAGARFSPDGSQLTYYRMAKGVAVDNNTYGTFDLVIAEANGRNPVVFGPGFPWARLWVAGTQGEGRAMVYAEQGRHIYGACASPEAKYLLFTRSVEDLGAIGKSQTTLAVLRWSDTPMLGDDNPALRREFPDAKPAHWLDLGPGWEPHWTYRDAPVAP